MNELLQKLTGGDLRSDGRANEVAEEVIKNPRLLNKLVEGLRESDNLVRARTTHALEKISRTNPEMLQGLTLQLIETALKDKVPMVKWHLAMIFGNIPFSEKEIDAVILTLFHLLNDENAFVKSWAIASLAIIGRKNKSKRKEIIGRIKALQNDESIAVRGRAIKALNILENEDEKIPISWLKARDLRILEDR